MPLVTLRRLMDGAQAGGYAIGSFNCYNLETVQAVLEAAEEVAAPVSIQASQGAIRYAGLENLAALVQAAARRASVPVALHLDHGTDFALVVRCIAAGFTSVMFDGSQYEKDENIARTREVVKIARAAGVSVEGEIGKIGGVEDDIAVAERDAMLTPVDDAIEFFRATGVDCLAMSFGTAHGHYRLPPRLAFDRLAAVHQATGAYLVMHGGSGVPDQDVQRSIALGVRKINIDTELREAFFAALRQAEAGDDPRRLLGTAREAMKERAREKLLLFGAADRAAAI